MKKDNIVVTPVDEPVAYYTQANVLGIKHLWNVLFKGRQFQAILWAIASNVYPNAGINRVGEWPQAAREIEDDIFDILQPHLDELVQRDLQFYVTMQNQGTAIYLGPEPYPVLYGTAVGLAE